MTCGTISAYKKGCHCDECKVPAREYKAKWRQRQREKRAAAKGVRLTHPCWFCSASFETELARVCHESNTHP